MTEQECRLEAEHRFQSDPSKCFQRHIREVYAEQECRPKLTSLKGATVIPVSNAEAATVIKRYEWLKTMGAGTVFCYGLKMSDELLGVACFNVGGSPEARNICADKTLVAKTICLCRGACVPHAPKDAGSFLVRYACKFAARDRGFQIFFAYSDPAAGEIGTIYQAVGWKNIGSGLGRPKDKTGGSHHSNFVSPEGKEVTSYMVGKTAKSLGWKEGSGTKRGFLLDMGYTRKPVQDKNKWVWFEDKTLESQCRFPFLPYPKRNL